MAEEEAAAKSVIEVIADKLGKAGKYAGWTDPRLLKEWGEMKDSRSYKTRDGLLAEMLEKGIAPLTWMRDRDEKLGLYPDADDPEFARRLYKKTEFATLASKPVSEDTCVKSRQAFETTAVQRLVARFLHPSTPYNGLLLNHGVGVGKTCSAITVAEMFLDVMPHNRVYILAPPAISDGFRKTIFDIEKLQRNDDTEFALTGERWKSPQCTGMTYLRLAGIAASDDKEEIEREVNKLIRQRYKIMGYAAFANMIQAEMNKISPDLPEEVRADFINSDLIKRFSDHLIIIDEAHNLRDAEAGEISDETDNAASSDAAEGKKLTPILRRILEVCEGLRLMLMTATPMYNTAPEIIFLLELLILNDTKNSKLVKKLLSKEEIFERDDKLKEGAEEKLARMIRRYVSYMRGENPNTFPLRLMPRTRKDESPISEYIGAYNLKSIRRSEGDIDAESMDKNVRDIFENLPIVVHDVAEDTFVGKQLTRYLATNQKPRKERGGEEGTEVSDMILDETMQLGNMVYPDGTFGKTGWANYFEKVKEKEDKDEKRKRRTGEPRVLKAAHFKYIGEEPIEKVFSLEALKSHAPKMAAIVRSITRSKGMSFVFSRYMSAGALPLAIALEMAGWCRVLADGTPAPLLLREAGAPKPKHYYIILTSDRDVTPNFKGLLNYATTLTAEEALTGSKVKAIIGSQVSSEGLDLKCIRELHIMDPWYHLNRIEQITGRGVRYCSHVLLPKEMRNCMIYLHAISIPEYETADLYAYRLASRKAVPIGKITRLMKENAWDCLLNHDAILLRGLDKIAMEDSQGKLVKDDTPGKEYKDKPFSSFCDFMEDCDFTCGGNKSLEIGQAEIGSDMSTYREADYRRTFIECQQKLATHFSGTGVVSEPISKILRIAFGGIPKSMALIGLRSMLGNIRIKHRDGIYGTLILKNGYVLFQPQKVTDIEIPSAYRFGTAYGRIPRLLRPARGSILKKEPLPEAVPKKIEKVEEKKAEAEEIVGEALDADKLRMKALSDIKAWMEIVEQIKTSAADEKELDIAAPAGWKKERFYGYRWVLSQFSSLKEMPSIAAMWWMDHLWTSAERDAVLAYWATDYVTLPAEEKAWADLLKPVAFFDGELRGYSIFDLSDLTLKTYCMYKKDKKAKARTLGICPSIYNETLGGIQGPPVNRITETDDVYGFLVTDSGRIVFKTVHKPSAGLKRISGSECSNDSNLKHHHIKIVSAMEALAAHAPRDPINGLLLSTDERTIPSKPKKNCAQTALMLKYSGSADYDKKDSKGKCVYKDDFAAINENINYLSLQQLCPYLEFILRYMDLKAVNGKRWFLPLVDAAKALPSDEKRKIKMT